MIVDSSALIAIVFDEPERATFIDAILRTGCSAGAATVTEAGIVADSRSGILGREFDGLLVELGIDIVPVSARHAHIARVAHRRYGRGSGSPARLNFGDCLTYALASESGDELLFKGADFGHTDLLVAPESVRL